MFISVYFCLLDVDLEEGKSALDCCIPTHFIKSSRYFLLCTNSIIQCNCFTSTCILW